MVKERKLENQKKIEDTNKKQSFLNRTQSSSIETKNFIKSKVNNKISKMIFYVHTYVAYLTDFILH